MNPGATTIGTTARRQPERRKRRVRFWTWRIVLGLLVALVALAVTGAVYQTEQWPAAWATHLLRDIRADTILGGSHEH